MKISEIKSNMVFLKNVKSQKRSSNLHKVVIPKNGFKLVDKEMKIYLTNQNVMIMIPKTKKNKWKSLFVHSDKIENYTKDKNVQSAWISFPSDIYFDKTKFSVYADQLNGILFYIPEGL